MPVSKFNFRQTFSTYLKREVGPERAQCYWTLFERLRTRLGYADYLGALQRYRIEYPHDVGLLDISRFLINYPFANRLYANSLDVIEHVKQWGTAVLLTDGDVVFQPRKVQCSGLHEAVNGRVLIYVHKEHELADVEARYPAAHYVMVDDKPRILAAIKRISGAASDHGLCEARPLCSGLKAAGISAQVRCEHRTNW